MIESCKKGLKTVKNFYKLDTKESKDLVKAVSKRTLMEFAPDEAVLVDSMVDQYLAIGESKTSDLVGKPKGKDIPLSFGSPDELLVLIAIPVVVAALKKISEIFAQSTYAQLKEAVQKVVQPKKNRLSQESQLVIQLEQFQREIIVKISGKALNHKRATALVNRILELVAEEVTPDAKT